MTKALSIHIGINHVDPDHYEGWDGKLFACEADAKDMRALAKKQGFSQSTLLLSQQGSTAAVTAAINDAAKKLGKGDLLFLTYSGHGGQVRDTNGDEADKDRMDETWVLFDRQLVDDELYDMWSKFKPGVRILVLSDSCHSGTVVRDVPDFISGGPRRRAMPRSVGEKVEKAHRALYRSIQKAHPGSEDAKVRASVLLISGCMDNQFSMDGEKNGAFTGTLKTVWANGKFPGTYRKFRDKIVSLMSSDQTPNYYFVGAQNATFEGQKPFTI
ncbi:MAG: caspase family protein [Blastocatellia bacterium]